MEAFDIALRASAVLFMVGSLGGAGLGLEPREALTALTDRRFLTRSLALSWLACPAIAYAIVRVLPLAPPYANGLLLLALAPCAPFAPVVARAAGASGSYMAGFLLLSAVGTIVIMPLAAPILIAGMPADALAIAGPLLAFVLVPLALGMTMKTMAADAADRLRRPVAAITQATGIAALALVALVYGRSVLDAVGSFAIASQILFIAMVSLTTHVAGVTLPPAQRAVLTLGLCSRNLGAAVAPLATGPHDPREMAMVAIAVPVTVIMSAIVARVIAPRVAGFA